MYVTLNKCKVVVLIVACDVSRCTEEEATGRFAWKVKHPQNNTLGLRLAFVTFA